MQPAEVSSAPALVVESTTFCAAASHHLLKARCESKLAEKDLTRRANQGHIVIVAKMLPAPKPVAGILFANTVE